MKTISIVTLAAAMALAVPALAQEAGDPGAVGTGHGLTGSNPGTDVQPGWRGYGYDPDVIPDSDTGRYGYGAEPVYPGDSGVIYEGRAAVPEVKPLNDPNPDTVRGEQNGQYMAR